MSREYPYGKAELIVTENIYAIKKAGDNLIITYHTKDIAKWIKESI